MVLKNLQGGNGETDIQYRLIDMGKERRGWEYGKSNMETYITICKIDKIRSDQSLSHVRLFATPWIAARQASLSITSSWYTPKVQKAGKALPCRGPFSFLCFSFPCILVWLLFSLLPKILYDLFLHFSISENTYNCVFYTHDGQA